MSHLFVAASVIPDKSRKMFEHKEDFRLADEDREDAIKTSTARIRMAADEEELDASFARVMDLLDEVIRYSLWTGVD